MGPDSSAQVGCLGASPVVLSLATKWVRACSFPVRLHVPREVLSLAYSISTSVSPNQMLSKMELKIGVFPLKSIKIKAANIGPKLGVPHTTAPVLTACSIDFTSPYSQCQYLVLPG
jgi:hypothetical protein